MAQLVKELPAMWETWVRSLGWENSPGEGKGNPLQYSGLENSTDCIAHGAWGRKESATAECLSLSLYTPTEGEGKGEVTQSCPTLCDPMDCNLLGFSVHGVLQARILEWIAISFSRGSS